MLASEITRTTPTAVNALDRAAPPPDLPSLGQTLQAQAMTDPAAAASAYRTAAATLSPVEQGVLARTAPAAASFAAFDFDIPGIPGLPDLPDLPSLPDVPFDFPGLPSVPGLPSLPGLPDLPSLPGLPSFPGLPSLPGLPDLPDIPNPLDLLRRGADAVREKLADLPHEVADRVADSMRGDKARELTPGERAFVEEAFGDRIDLDDVRFVDGPGNSPIARAAFANGNPAITVGDTVYFKPGHFSKDFTATADGRNLLNHELTHVMQYETLGYGSFTARYGREFAEARGDADKMYDYASRDTVFDTETLEGQAQMVGDYAEIRHSTDPADQAKIADLEKRLEGTGIYGL